MSRLRPAPTTNGLHPIVGTGDENARFLQFRLLTLASGEVYDGASEGVETLAVILSGTATVTVAGARWSDLGTRMTVWDGPPASVYIPLNEDFQVRATTSVTIALCAAVTDESYSPFAVQPDEVNVSERGGQNWNRTIRDILTEKGDGRVSRLVVGETINAPGEWSSYPPHKHDGEFAPEEPNFEEIYHYQIDPPTGFGVQVHYTADRAINDAHIVRNGDTFVIEKGYHPLVAAGAHHLYYLWVMAGDTGRELRPYTQPEFRNLL